MESKAQKFKRISEVFNINEYSMKKLRQIEGLEIVLLVDDSGSMNTPVDSNAGGAFDEKKTRWEELKYTTSVIVSIASVMDPNGLDIYFLNREPVLNVTNIDQVTKAFIPPPDGPTPICPALRRILKDKASVAEERKLLIIIATDGVPTSPEGYDDRRTLEYILRNERRLDGKVFVTFVACTDDSKTMEYLNKWDKEIKYLDVVDDYKTESMEVAKKQGSSYKFSFGDYAVKCLLGSVDETMDNLDEKKISGCCTIS